MDSSSRSCLNVKGDVCVADTTPAQETGENHAVGDARRGGRNGSVAGISPSIVIVIVREKTTSPNIPISGKLPSYFTVVK